MSESEQQVHQSRTQKPQVELYRNGNWEVVDKDTGDFPIVVKQTVTPEWAQEVMDKRNKTNRPINKRRVDRYARDAITGNWQVIHQGIAFYEDGSLADGQHRLLGIAQAKVTVVTFIAYGLERKAGEVIDEGRPRSDRDVAHLSGLELSASFVSTANYLIEIMGLQFTRLEKMRFYEKHKDALNFVVNNISRKHVNRAPILAAVVKAYYSQNRSRLIDFLDVLQKGEFKPGEDEAAFRLREFAMDNGSRNDGSFRRELFNKTKSALVFFLEKKPMQKLHGIAYEPFMLPEEEQMKREETFKNRSAAMTAARAKDRQRSKPKTVYVEGTVAPQSHSDSSNEGYGG